MTTSRSTLMNSVEHIKDYAAKKLGEYGCGENDLHELLRKRAMDPRTREGLLGLSGSIIPANGGAQAAAKVYTLASETLEAAKFEYDDSPDGILVRALIRDYQDRVPTLLFLLGQAYTQLIAISGVTDVDSSIATDSYELAKYLHRIKRRISREDARQAKAVVNRQIVRDKDALEIGERGKYLCGIGSKLKANAGNELHVTRDVMYYLDSNKLWDTPPLNGRLSDTTVRKILRDGGVISPAKSR